MLTFDCYGTIIDWEAGIVRALRTLLQGRAEELGDDELLALYGRFEPVAQRGPFRRYRDVLEEVARRFGEELGAPVGQGGAERFAASVGDWPPFSDSREALRTLGSRYRLAVVSNVDDELFDRTSEQLGIDFDEVVTAEQVGSYKPETAHFDEMLRRLDLPKERVVHVAQSLFHDIAPAKSLGFTCVWIDRRSGREGGATPPARATPDMTFPDLAALAAEAGA